jgi:hypothetical protein
LWQARIVALSVFGPYVAGSARTEQIAVFGLLAWILVTGWPRMVSAPFGPAPFLLAWGGVCAVMLVSTPFRPADPMLYGSQPVSHTLSAMAIPLALIVITWYWTLSADPAALILAVAPLVTAAMCVNAAIEFAQLSAGNASLGILPRFWDAAPSAGSVAARAAGNGRYTGIFDQPAEAGIAYGVALLLLIWLARRSLRPVWACAAAVLLAAGGVLTLSKVFLLAALPVAAFTVLRGRGRLRVAVTAGACGGLVWCAGAAGLLPGWGAGAVSLAALASPQSLTATWTAGRYGAGGTLGPVAADVLHVAPWGGFGAGGVGVPYDSLWLQVLAVSGVLGVMLTCAVFVLAAWRLAAVRAAMPRAEWHLACGAAVLAAAASAGISSLTANRAGTLLWLVAGVLITARGALTRPGRQPVP